MSGYEKERDGFHPSHIAVLELSWRPDGGLRICSPSHPGMVLSHASPDKVMLDVLPVLAVLGFTPPNAGGA